MKSRKLKAMITKLAWISSDFSLLLTETPQAIAFYLG